MHFELLPQGQIVKHEYYKGVLQQLREQNWKIDQSYDEKTHDSFTQFFFQFISFVSKITWLFSPSLLIPRPSYSPNNQWWKNIILIHNKFIKGLLCEMETPIGKPVNRRRDYFEWDKGQWLICKKNNKNLKYNVRLFPEQTSYIVLILYEK